MIVSTFLAHGVTDAPHQQAPPRDTAEGEVARLKLQEQSLLLEISDLCAALQNTQKEARRERKALQQHVERQQARLRRSAHTSRHFQSDTAFAMKNASRAATAVTCRQPSDIAPT